MCERGRAREYGVEVVNWVIVSCTMLELNIVISHLEALIPPSNGSALDIPLAVIGMVVAFNFSGLIKA